MAAVGLRRRSQIDEELERVRAQAEKLRSQLRQGSDSRGDEADKANDLMQRATDMALCHHLQRELQQLILAEKRFTQGLASVCEDCGQPIEAARLEILVNVTRCASCQRRAEQKAGRRRRHAA